MFETTTKKTFPKKLITKWEKKNKVFQITNITAKSHNAHTIRFWAGTMSSLNTLLWHNSFDIFHKRQKSDPRFHCLQLCFEHRRWQVRAIARDRCEACFFSKEISHTTTKATWTNALPKHLLLASWANNKKWSAKGGSKIMVPKKGPANFTRHKISIWGSVWWWILSLNLIIRRIPFTILLPSNGGLVEIKCPKIS